MSGPFNGGAYMDEGDIAAAVWLGDTCLSLGQPINAALAWAIAVDGLTAKHGFEKVSKSRFLVDLHILDRTTRGLTMMRDNFNRLNTDASTILSTTSNQAKSQLVTVSLTRLSHSLYQHHAPNRLAVNIQIAEGFLVQQLIASSSWPLQYDPYFRAEQAINLVRDMRRPSAVYSMGFVTSVSLGNSKKLDYATKRSVEWLMETVRNGLKFHSIIHKELADRIIVQVTHDQNKINCLQSFQIVFRKLTLRSVYGFSVAGPNILTRGYGGNVNPLANDRFLAIRQEVVDRLKQYAEQCELAAQGKGVPPEHPTIPEVGDTPVPEMDGKPTTYTTPTHVEIDGTGITNFAVELPGSMPATR